MNSQKAGAVAVEGGTTAGAGAGAEAETYDDASSGIGDKISKSTVCALLKTTY